LVDDDFILSLDSRVLLRHLSDEPKLLIGSNIEVIVANAFKCTGVSSVLFESGTRLIEIGSESFPSCRSLEAFTVPESVEILGDRCFKGCLEMETIRFEGSSRLKRIGEQSFMGCKLHSIAIPALTEEIDGSAFLSCPLLTIQVAPGNRNFKVEGHLLMTSDGTEIVRYFGLDLQIVVGRKVKVLGKLCFEGCKHLDQIDFEVGSELERISAAALRDCESLIRVEIPASVEIVAEFSFEGCTELESCLIAEDSSLVTIGATAFAKCTSLRSFYFPLRVGEIGRNCFQNCIHLYQLEFPSSESLKTIVGDRSLDDALFEFGMSESSSLLRIEVEDGGIELELEFAGWSSVSGGDDGDFPLTLVRYHE
jgi:hypothetical protein